MKDKGFDEYGNYGENNPPVGVTEKKYELMIDPTPAGWAYGFPKPLPKEAVLGKGADLFIAPDFDLVKWVVEQGYPEESFQYYRYYPYEVKDDAS